MKAILFLIMIFAEALLAVVMMMFLFMLAVAFQEAVIKPIRLKIFRIRKHSTRKGKS